MKAKIRKYLGQENNKPVYSKEPDLIELELDENYWRNEFAKTALLHVDAYSTEKVLAEHCFKIADAMINEMKRRKMNAKL